VPDGHHACSHHQNDPVKLEKLAKSTYHMQHFGLLLDKLRQTPDGDGSLLDHSISCMGRGIRTATSTSIWTCRWWWSRRAGTLKAAGMCATATTRAGHLYVSVLDKLGAPMDQFGDSTGKLDYLTPSKRPPLAGDRAPALAHESFFFVSDLPAWRSSSKPFAILRA